MPAQYVVVQYVPDIVRNERVNIGVVAFGDNRVKTHFLVNWQRVRTLSGENVKYVKSLCARLSLIDEEGIRETIKRQAALDTVQFTTPAGSLLSPEALVVDAAKRFLIDTSVEVRKYRDRAAAIAYTQMHLKQALKTKFGSVGSKLVQESYSVPGQHDSHDFDIGIANGKPIVAAQAISFEVPILRNLKKSIDATAWAIEDVRRKDSSFPLAVVTFPSTSRAELFQRSKDTFSELGANVVEESGIQSWATEVANASASIVRQNK